MAFEGIEVSGGSVQSIIAGFGENTAVATRLLSEAGIHKVDLESWYPLPAVLGVLNSVQEKVGRHVMHQVGLKIPENARSPIDLKTLGDIPQAIAFLDMGYHLNHRRNGKVMGDPAAGRMDEGIGHYGAKLVAAENKVVSVCDTPYPCEMDRGILAAMAKMFRPSAMTVHAPGPCRKTGAAACTYHVTWL